MNYVSKMTMMIALIMSAHIKGAEVIENNPLVPMIQEVAVELLHNLATIQEKNPASLVSCQEIIAQALVLLSDMQQVVDEANKCNVCQKTKIDRLADKCGCHNKTRNDVLVDKCPVCGGKTKTEKLIEKCLTCAEKHQSKIDALAAGKINK